jgi:Ca-activated chloride channel family protein
MPAPEGDVTLGVAQVFLPDRERLAVEVRLEPEAVDHAARLGAEAILTVVFDEAGPEETIVKLPVRFARGGAAAKTFSIAGRAVQQVAP